MLEFIARITQLFLTRDKKIKKSGVCILILSMLVGCAESDNHIDPEYSRQFADNFSLNQIEAISDGGITREEYDIGFQNYRTCMENIGFPLQDVREIDLKYDYWYDIEADKHGAEDCYFKEFSQINGGWSMRPEVAELSDTAQVVRQCLIGHGIEPAETHLERVDQAIAHGLDLGNDCVP